MLLLLFLCIVISHGQPAPPDSDSSSNSGIHSAGHSPARPSADWEWGAQPFAVDSDTSDEEAECPAAFEYGEQLNITFPLKYLFLENVLYPKPLSMIKSVVTVFAYHPVMSLILIKYCKDNPI